jgi:hypothetical protein
MSDTMRSRIPNPLSAAVALIVISTALSACGDSDKPDTTPTSTSTTSTVPATTTTTTPLDPTAFAVWPTASSTTRYNTPVAAARGFATDLVGFVNPIVGAFRAGDARSGEVPVRARAGGPVTTVLVRKIGTDNSWWVLGSATPNIDIVAPVANALITSPLQLRGSSTAFEATVNYALRQDDVAKPLTEGFVMGGANGEMGPFSTSVPFAKPASASGAVVMYVVSMADGHVAEASVIRVRYSDG